MQRLYAVDCDVASQTLASDFCGRGPHGLVQCVKPAFSYRDR